MTKHTVIVEEGDHIEVRPRRNPEKRAVVYTVDIHDDLIGEELPSTVTLAHTDEEALRQVAGALSGQLGLNRMPAMPLRCPYYTNGVYERQCERPYDHPGEHRLYTGHGDYWFGAHTAVLDPPGDTPTPPVLELDQPQVNAELERAAEGRDTFRGRVKPTEFAVPDYGYVEAEARDIAVEQVRAEEMADYDRLTAALRGTSERTEDDDALRAAYAAAVGAKLNVGARAAQAVRTVADVLDGVAAQMRGMR